MLNLAVKNVAWKNNLSNNNNKLWNIIILAIDNDIITRVLTHYSRKRF